VQTIHLYLCKGISAYVMRERSQVDCPALLMPSDKEDLASITLLPKIPNDPVKNAVNTFENGSVVNIKMTNFWAVACATDYSKIYLRHLSIMDLFQISNRSPILTSGSAELVIRWLVSLSGVIP
jgi:hypothetical protein